MKIKSLALLIISLFVTEVSFASNNAFQIVSDNDDTIKITHTLNFAAASWNTLFSRAVFTGTTELYQGWAQTGAEIRVVSGGIEAFSGYTVKTLNKNKIPFVGLYERPGTSITVYDFKLKTIVELANLTSEPFVFMGDDTQVDYRVYADYQKLNPRRVLAAYIHRVTGHKLPDYVIPYYTDFEVALIEHENGRLGDEALAKSANAILNLKDSRKLFPTFMLCPANTTDFSAPFMQSLKNLNPKQAKLVIDATEKILKSCQERDSDDVEIDDGDSSGS